MGSWRHGPPALIVTVFVLTISQACRSERPEKSSRDAAADRSVLLSAEAFDTAPRLRLDSEPLLSLGGAADAAAHRLYDVAAVLLLDDGRLVVANRGENEVLIFGNDGRFQVSFGREGQGPGEFERVIWLAALTDGDIMAGDAASRRVTVFSPDGTYRRDFRMAAGPADAWASAVPPSPLSAFPDGFVVAVRYHPVSPGKGAQRPGIEVSLLSPLGELEETLGTWPGDELFTYENGPLLEIVTPLFARRTHVVASGDAIWIADGATWSIEKHARNGGAAALIRAERVGASVTDVAVEAALDRKYASAGTGPAMDSLRAAQRRITYHERVPAIDGMLPDGLDGVWIAEYPDPSTGSRPWVWLSGDGHLSAKLDVPARYEIMAFANRRVIVLERDDLGRERVSVLTWSPAG